MQEKETTRQRPSYRIINYYWVLSLLGLIIFFCLSVLLAPIISGDVESTEVGKVILLLIGCINLLLGIAWLITHWKHDYSFAILIRVFIGILSSIGIIWLALQYKLPSLTGMLVQKSDSTFCLSIVEENTSIRTALGDGVTVYTRPSTHIYLHDSWWPWQKRLVGVETLHTGQRVKVTYEGFIFLDGSIYATEIIILGDNFTSPKINYMCDFSLEGT